MSILQQRQRGGESPQIQEICLLDPAFLSIHRTSRLASSNVVCMQLSSLCHWCLVPGFCYDPSVTITADPKCNAKARHPMCVVSPFMYRYIPSPPWERTQSQKSWQVFVGCTQRGWSINISVPLSALVEAGVKPPRSGSRRRLWWA